MKRTIALTLTTMLFVQATLIVGLAAVVKPIPGARVTASHPQALNPPHLSEMPSVDRVMSAMKVDDPRETALRQMGAFYQLIEIIKTLSGRREFRGFTPDEGRVIGAYDLARYNVAQAADKAFPGPVQGASKFSFQTPYGYGRWDHRFGVEGIQTFKTFLSPGLKAEFDKIVQADNARREAREQSDRNNSPVAQPSQVSPQQAQTVSPGSKEELRRCIASGRSQRVCFSEVLDNGMGQLTGINLKMPSASGLRMTGDYSSRGGFRLIFQPDKVTMVCREVPSPQPYTVEVTGTQALVKIHDGNKPVVFTLTPDGKLSGSGSIRVTGQVPSGTRTEETMGMTTETTTRTRQLSPGEQRNYPNAQQNGSVFTVQEDATRLVYGPTGTRTVTDFVTKSADCSIGVLSPIGATPLPPDIESPFGALTTILSGASVLMKGGSADQAYREMLNLDKAPPPGLRMSGRYAGESGFSITFHPESATVACGDAERAHEYSIQRSANQILLKIQDSAAPITLQVRPDGSLLGDGSVQVNGRVITGTTDDPDNPFVFAPKIGRCSVGSLFANGAVPANRPASPAASAVGPSSPTTPSAPVAAGPSATAPPTTGTTNPAAPAALLAIASGFAPQPGTVNPLAGKTVLVIKDSFESILAKAGWTQPGSPSKALTAWARACESRSPRCQQGIEAMRPYLVSSAKLDGNGVFTFNNARAGTYYLVVQTSYNGLHLVWNLRVDLKPGANSITLDQRNTTPLDR